MTTTHNPLSKAKAFWNMSGSNGGWMFPFELESIGNTVFGKLDGDELYESEKRGLGGYYCRIDNSCLSLNGYRAAALCPNSDGYSLYIRVNSENKGHFTLFSSNFLGLTHHPSGYIFAFAAQKIPSGCTYREIPLTKLDFSGWLDLVLTIDRDSMRFYVNGEQKCAVDMNWKIKPAFIDDLLIGARRCQKPDTYGTTIPRSRMSGRMGAFAVWQYCLSNEEIAFLSGCNEITSADQTTPEAVICTAYNKFFDASAKADVSACRELYSVLRSYAVLDPSRPLYHLSQPFGTIFDPCGAFWYDNKYHVFSYRNVNYMLEYSSLDHYVSEDLIHWTEYPIGPFTDADEDVFCIYLMNHFIDGDGRLRILYTGQGIEGKCGILAESNDKTITYTNKKAVLKNFHHDGHVFKYGDKWYTITSRMMKGMRTDGKGDAVVLFSSDDLENWTEESEIFSQPRTEWNKNGFLEFPYLLFFDDKALLMVGGDIRYFIGTFDWNEKKFIPDNPDGIRLDPVNPFYCFNPLCVDNKGENGSERRIIMGLYSQIGDTGHGVMPWFGIHTMPRIFTFCTDHIRQDPIPEFEKLRGECDRADDIILEEGTRYIIRKNISPYNEISATFSAESYGDYGVVLYYGEREVSVIYHSNDGRYEISGDALNIGSCPAYHTDGEELEIRVFTDNRLIEVYVNGQVCTTAVNEAVPGNMSIGIISQKGTIHCRSLCVWEFRKDLLI